MKHNNISFIEKIRDAKYLEIPSMWNNPENAFDFLVSTNPEKEQHPVMMPVWHTPTAISESSKLFVTIDNTSITGSSETLTIQTISSTAQKAQNYLFIREAKAHMETQHINYKLNTMDGAVKSRNGKAISSTPQRLGEWFRAIREKRGLTLTYVATQADITKGYLSGFEGGYKNPDRKILRRLGQILDVPYGVIELAEELKTVSNEKDALFFRRFLSGMQEITDSLIDEIGLSGYQTTE